MKTFKWSEEQKKALLGSVRKWKRIAAGTSTNGGVNDCPCCAIWVLKVVRGMRCKGCPIAQFTGKKECFDTPYYDVYGDTLSENPSVRSATTELNFLRAVYLAGGGK